ncbi:MAG TPA: hypothetical protein PK886_00565 [Candidatus Paceibacterota bacterium]|nr:hypothetical protein [Candidatus Paceibacterota bacterium]
MNKIISKIYIVILGLVFILPIGAFAEGQGSYFSANTLSATSITTSTAKLSGSVSFDEGSGTAWFEYGTNYNLDESTSVLRYVSKYEGVAQGISKSIGSLKANTTYYFKVCLETNIRGVTCGNTMSFKTKSAPVATTVSSSTSTSTNSSSNSNSNSSSSSSSSSSNTNDDDKKDDNKEDENSQTASVAGSTRDGNFLPDTFLEWILTIVLIFFIVLFGRYLYLKRQEEKEEEEKRKKEMLIRGQMA